MDKRMKEIHGIGFSCEAFNTQRDIPWFLWATDALGVWAVNEKNTAIAYASRTERDKALAFAADKLHDFYALDTVIPAEQLQEMLRKKEQSKD
jgi:hypothetical protein